MADKISEDSFLDAKEGVPSGEHHEMTPEEKKARNRRNLFMALGVIIFILLVYSTTILRMAQNIRGAE